MKLFSRLTTLMLLVGAFLFFGNDATYAQETTSIIDKYEEVDITNFVTEPATPIAEKVRSNLFLTSVMILPFMILPHIILLLAITKFGKGKGDREPAKFHENLPLEVAWTVIPAVVLILMAVPTYSLIRDIENPPKPDMNISITGYQFFWVYEYPDYNDMTVSSAIGDPLVVPTGKNVVATMTSKDVLHAWWVPAFGVKMDTVPGRLSQVWFNIEKPGFYKGQCAEICGSGHAQMLIDVVALPPDEFEQWLVEKDATATPEEDSEVALLLNED